MTGQRLLHAYARLHQAFNETYGQPLFAAQLDQFLTAQPAWVELRPQLDAFFKASYAVHFGPDAGHSPAGYPPERLLELALACRRCERRA